jgi:hypothetical protein
MPVKPAPTAQELLDIDGLLTQGKTDEARTRLAALRSSYPRTPRCAGARRACRRSRPEGAAAAIQLFAEALALDPTLARDLGFHAQVDALLRQRPVTEAAIDLAIALGPQGNGVLLNYINDPKSWATYPSARRSARRWPRTRPPPPRSTRRSTPAATCGSTPSRRPPARP